MIKRIFLVLVAAQLSLTALSVLTTQTSLVGEANAQQNNVTLPPKTHSAFFEPMGYPTEDGKTEFVCPKPPHPSKDLSQWAAGLKPVRELSNESLARELELLEPLLQRETYIINAIIGRYDEAYNEFWGRTNSVNDLVKALDGLNDPADVQKQIQARALIRILSRPEYARMLNSSLIPMEQYLTDKAREYYAQYGGLENARKAKRTKWDPNSNVPQETSVGGAAVGKLQPDGTLDIDGLNFKIFLKTAQGDFFRLVKVNKQAVEGKDIVIPGHIMYKGKAYPVKEIGSSALAGAGAKTVSIPATVTLIERSAFVNMPYIKIIDIPSSVKEIKHFAFSGCRELTEVRIPDSVTKLGGQIFENCPKLANVILPKNLEAIPQRCFYNCRSLTGIKIPETVKSIGSEAFYNCSTLASITLPSALETIGWAAFKNCSKLTSLYIPSSVTEIDTETTAGCKSLKTITMSSAYNNYYVLVRIFGGSEIFPMSYVNAAKIPPAFKFEDNE